MKIIVRVSPNADIVRVEAAIRNALMAYDLDVRSIQVVTTAFGQEEYARGPEKTEA